MLSAELLSSFLPLTYFFSFLQLHHDLVLLFELYLIHFELFLFYNIFWTDVGVFIFLLGHQEVDFIFKVEVVFSKSIVLLLDICVNLFEFLYVVNIIKLLFELLFFKITLFVLHFIYLISIMKPSNKEIKNVRALKDKSLL